MPNQSPVRVLASTSRSARANGSSRPRDRVSALKAVSSDRRRGATAEVVISSPQSLPRWLRLLLEIQQGTSLGLLLVIGTILGLYGWSVQSQRLWGQKYEHLKQLQRQERQLIAANEVLKYQMAEQAQSPATGLVNPMPAKTIFLKSLPPRPQRDFPPSIKKPQRSEPSPLSY